VTRIGLANANPARVWRGHADTDVDAALKADWEGW
jgi:hypothetical protein